MSFFILPTSCAVLWLRDREGVKAFVRLFGRACRSRADHLTACARRAPWPPPGARRRRRRRPVGPWLHVRPARGSPTADCSARCRHPGRRHSWVERSSAEVGAAELHSASALIDQGRRASTGGGRPSLHAGPDRRDRGIPVDAGGAKMAAIAGGLRVVMAFTLVYTAEHYVVDIRLGWLLAAWCCSRQVLRVLAKSQVCTRVSGLEGGVCPKLMSPAISSFEPGHMVGDPDTPYYASCATVGKCNMVACQTRIRHQSGPALENYNPATSPC